MSVPSVSERHHICVVCVLCCYLVVHLTENGILQNQPPGQVDDPTSSMVLTSHKGYFVDVRVRKAATADEPVLPNEGGPFERLLWASAGQKIMTDKMEEGSRHGERKCANWLQGLSFSSDYMKAGDPLIPQDLDDWVVGQAVIEDPVTGERIEYDELSVDMPIQPNGCDGLRKSVVLMLQDDEHAVRGMVVRVGDWCQGLVQMGQDVSVERWRWVGRKTREPPSRDEHGDQCITITGRDIFAPNTFDSYRTAHHDNPGEWERQVRIGSRLVPCGLTFLESVARNSLDGVEEGSIVQAGDMSWMVVENYVW